MKGGPIHNIESFESSGKINVELQDDHNIFFVVDADVEDTFGLEVEHRSAFEGALSTCCSLFSHQVPVLHQLPSR